MSLVTLSIDLYCDSIHSGHPIYRVYVDDELLTERTWTWPSYEVYIKENIEIDVEPGNHRIRIDNCNSASNFSFKNVTVNGQVVESSSAWQDYTFNI